MPWETCRNVTISLWICQCSDVPQLFFSWFQTQHALVTMRHWFSFELNSGWIQTIHGQLTNGSVITRSAIIIPKSNSRHWRPRAIRLGCFVTIADNSWHCLMVETISAIVIDCQNGNCYCNIVMDITVISYIHVYTHFFIQYVYIYILYYIQLYIILYIIICYIIYSYIYI